MRCYFQALRGLLSAAVLGALLPASGMAQKASQGGGGEVAPSAGAVAPSSVLWIDGEEVPAELYARWLIEEVGPPLVREFAEGWVVERAARARGLEVSAERIEEQLEDELRVRIDHAFHGRREEWLEELSRLGRSEAGHRLQRRTELGPLLHATALAAQGRVVPEEKIERDWELACGPRGRAFELDMLKVQVVVPLPEGEELSQAALEQAAQSARAEGLERARALHARLLRGEDFAALARVESDDEATRVLGGRVERFRREGWPADFVTALFGLGRGELSEPLFARGGWWLVRVRGGTDTPLESVRAELERRLLERGPEQDEVGAAWNAAVAGIRVEVQPGMLAAPERSGAEQPDPVALLINGEPVSRKSYARWLLHARGEASWQAFAEAWLVERRAQARGVEVSPEEVDLRVREALDELIARSHQGDRDLWRAYLASAGRDEALFLAQLARRQRLQLLVEKLILSERVVEAAAVKARFESLYGPLGRRAHARAILLEIPRPELEPGLSKAEVEARLAALVEARRLDAQRLVERARGGEDFSTLARRHSDEPFTHERGGELEGGFQPDGWPPEVARAVLALPRGGVSDPLLAGRWWALFELVDYEPVELEAEFDRLAAELRSRRPDPAEIAGYRNQLLQATAIEILPGMTR